MKCDGVLQGIPSLCTICDKDGQQPFDIRPYHCQLGHHWAQVGWCASLILPWNTRKGQTTEQLTPSAKSQSVMIM